MTIFFSSLLASIALAVTGSLTFWKVEQPYHFYIPIVLFLGGYLVCIAIWWCLLWLFGRVYYKKDYNTHSKWAKFWHNNGHRWLMVHANIKIKLTGRDKLPISKRYLLVSNHRSSFDSMTLTPALHTEDFSFITKPSNFKIPLFNRFMRGMAYMPIERDNPIQSLEVMKKAASLIQNDVSNVVVYPEGTRLREGLIGDFHEGVFNIALRAKCPVVIVTTSGAENVKKNYPWKRTKVRIDILGTLDYSMIEGMTAKAISDKVHKIMSDHLKKVEALGW